MSKTRQPKFIKEILFNQQKLKIYQFDQLEVSAISNLKEKCISLALLFIRLDTSVRLLGYVESMNHMEGLGKNFNSANKNKSCTVVVPRC